MNASAVSDAHRNAEINGIKNCRFVCGKVRFSFPSLSIVVNVIQTRTCIRWQDLQ